MDPDQASTDSAGGDGPAAAGAAEMTTLQAEMRALELEAKDAAATTIANWWVWHHNRSVFSRLKFALHQSAGAITSEVLKQLCPHEAALLADPTLEPVLRFRFGTPGFGSPSFPPDILYKVFLTRDGSSVVYLSGKKMIKPASDAAVDSLGQMGRRKFIDQMVEDSLQHERTGVQDELDVTSMKEYMQYASTVDNQPAWLGGRDNGWRQLQPTAQHGVLYDFMTFARGDEPSTRLLKQVPNLREPESLCDIEEKLRIVQERSLKASRKLGTKDVKGAKMDKSKRKKHMAHMRKLYGLGSPETTEAAPISAKVPLDDEVIRMPDASLGMTQEWDDTAGVDEDESLFQWSQELPVTDFDGL